MKQPRTPRLARLSEPEPAPPWGLSVVILSVVVALVIGLASAAFVQTWLPDRPTTPLAAWNLAGALIILFVFQSRRRPEDRAALRLTPPGVALPLLLVVNIGAAMLLDLIGQVITQSQSLVPPPELIPLAQIPGEAFAWVFALLLMLLAQPVAEELLFRGVAQPALRALLGPWPGLLVTALASGVFHLIAYPPVLASASQSALVWYGFLLPALAGLVFVVNRAATGSTRAAIFAHAAFGVFALLKVYMGTV